ncbi:hypothetical protein [Actinomadura alba]|uniref:Uncharacterized protein n=1 Tax=Actinomadura alba TaxID=406431 RepID=A0ABR7LZV1_9ACTN|nr:hypothetical protein [Actinomadura alba]MBC6470378.1 hypothetical protein [Actinomadura alba]
MAIAMSGLVFAGGAALMIGGATSASAEAMAAAPQVTSAKSSCGHRRGCGCNRSCGCRRGCGGCNRHHGRHSNRHTFSHNQRIVVINRNNNISRSGPEIGQRRGFRGLDDLRGVDDDDFGDGGGWND